MRSVQRGLGCPPAAAPQAAAPSDFPHLLKGDSFSLDYSLMGTNRAEQGVCVWGGAQVYI